MDEGHDVVLYALALVGAEPVAQAAKGLAGQGDQAEEEGGGDGGADGLRRSTAADGGDRVIHEGAREPDGGGGQETLKGDRGGGGEGPLRGGIPDKAKGAGDVLK